MFNRDKSVISRHLNNIFKTGELRRQAAVAKNATVQTEGSRTVSRNIEYFNLDAIISVGYRVNSKPCTEFRIWATNVLKQHLVEGNRLRVADPTNFRPAYPVASKYSEKKVVSDGTKSNLYHEELQDFG